MRLLPLAFSFVLISTMAWAVKPVDVTKRNRIFPNQQFSKDTVPLQKNNTLLNQRFEKSEWNRGAMSPIGNRTAPITMGGTFQKEEMSFPSFRREEAFISVGDQAPSFAGREARLANWGERWDNKKARTFDVEAIPGAMMGLNEYYLFTDQLSMQDINRYQFRRSHSSDEGLNRVRAAGQVLE